MKKKIIVTDDDIETLTILKEFLSLENFEIFTAVNGIQLFEILRTNKPDLILLDINMNWISGYDLCSALKKSEVYKNIPVVFISAKTNQEDIDLGLQLGAEDYITKPFELNKLLLKIQKILKI